jgi:hypothetical protein
MSASSRLSDSYAGVHIISGEASLQCSPELKATGTLLLLLLVVVVVVERVVGRLIVSLPRP